MSKIDINSDQFFYVGRYGAEVKKPYMTLFTDAKTEFRTARKY
jgi:hypothetical protein